MPSFLIYFKESSKKLILDVEAGYDLLLWRHFLKLRKMMNKNLEKEDPQDRLSTSLRIRKSRKLQSFPLAPILLVQNLVDVGLSWS